MNPKWQYGGYNGNVRQIDATTWEAALDVGDGVIYGKADNPDKAIESAKKTFDTMGWTKVEAGEESTRDCPVCGMPLRVGRNHQTGIDHFYDDAGLHTCKLPETTD